MSGNETTGASNRNSLNTQAFRRLREAIDNWYSYRDRCVSDWDNLFREHEKALLEASGPDDFGNKVARMLAAAEDVHIKVELCGGRRVPTSPFNFRANFKEETLERVVPNFKRQNDTVATGLFPDGFAYLMIRSWNHRKKNDIEAAFQALAQWEKAPGLIIDVRPNDGGDSKLAMELAGCFIDGPVQYAKYAWCDPRGPAGFGAPQDAILNPRANRPKFRGPIRVLAGPKCVSSTEDFLLMMKQVDGCRLVGGRSYGSSGNPKPRALGNGVTVHLPVWRALRPNGTCFEGEGIDPDLPVPTQPADFDSDDPIIAAALNDLERAKPAR